jgi:threonine/homoserine/homoserine lactone efflux protein
VPDTTSLLSFVAAALIVLLSPGPGVLYVSARSLSQGHRAGLVSVFGLSLGALVHVAAATAGLSAILLASSVAFGTVKGLGAAYLIYLGIRTLLAPRAAATLEASTRRSLNRILLDGVVVTLLNPKIAVFFLAFLPQFVDSRGAPVSQQVLMLGLIYVGLALVTDSSYALFAATIRRWLGGRLRQGPLPQYATGALYIGLGLNTALNGRRRW